MVRQSHIRTHLALYITSTCPKLPKRKNNISFHYVDLVVFVLGTKKCIV